MPPGCASSTITVTSLYDANACSASQQRLTMRLPSDWDRPAVCSCPCVRCPVRSLPGNTPVWTWYVPHALWPSPSGKQDSLWGPNRAWQLDDKMAVSETGFIVKQWEHILRMSHEHDLDQWFSTFSSKGARPTILFEINTKKVSTQVNWQVYFIAEGSLLKYQWCYWKTAESHTKNGWESQWRSTDLDIIFWTAVQQRRVTMPFISTQQHCVLLNTCISRTSSEFKDQHISFFLREVYFVD